MKICFFGDSESIHVQRWCNYFKSLGHAVSLISFKEKSLDGIETYYVNSGNIAEKGGNWKVLKSFPKVKKILKTIKPDIFHALYATSYGVTGALCNYKPFIITCLGSDVLISPKNSKIYRILLKFAFRKSTWITTMSDHMKVEVENLGIPCEKISTVPFGIDPSIFNCQNRNISKKEFIVTSTRNFELIYNIPHLLKAIVLVKGKIPNLKVKLIGAGSLKAEFEQFISDKGLENMVEIVGKLPQIEIAEFLKNSHVFVSVSLSDGNNISLNEAMACGSLCIATNIEANRQWLKDQENGFLVEINDVNTLAERIEFAYLNFETFQEKSLPLNLKIIEEKAIWSKNMKQVESKYLELIHGK